MDIYTDITNTGNLVISFKENYINPINKEINLIESTRKINKEQIEFLLEFNIDIKAHTTEALKLDRKKIIGKNIYKALLNKANKQINFYDIEKILNSNKRYFIIGTLEDIIVLKINNDTFISNNDNNILKNPMGISGNIKIGNKKIDVIYLNDKVENSCLLLSTIKDYDNTYKITFFNNDNNNRIQKFS